MSQTDEARTEWLDLGDIANDLGVSRNLLLSLARKGEFPEILLIGTRKKLVRRDLYELWIERSLVNPKTEEQLRRRQRFGSREQWRQPAECREKLVRGRPRRANAN